MTPILRSLNTDWSELAAIPQARSDAAALVDGAPRTRVVGEPQVRAFAPSAVRALLCGGQEFGNRVRLAVVDSDGQAGCAGPHTRSSAGAGGRRATLES
jgi:hypothetical protein